MQRKDPYPLSFAPRWRLATSRFALHSIHLHVVEYFKLKTNFPLSHGICDLLLARSHLYIQYPSFISKPVRKWRGIMANILQGLCGEAAGNPVCCTPSATGGCIEKTKQRNHHKMTWFSSRVGPAVLLGNCYSILLGSGCVDYRVDSSRIAFDLEGSFGVDVCVTM